jgi:hypothetical protein
MIRRMRMRTLGWVVVLALGGCGGAVGDAPVPASAAADGAIAAGAERPSPIVGTLRMRDRDVPLTAASLEARGNEQLREMTARAVWADVDRDHVEPATGPTPSELTGLPASLLD